MITVKMIIIAIGSSSYMTLTLREYANIAVPQTSNISVNIYLFKQTVIELGKLVGKQAEGIPKIKKGKLNQIPFHCEQLNSAITLKKK